MGQADIDRVLAGEESYDDLDDADQAVVRAEWDRRIARCRDGLNLETDFIAEGQTWWVVGDAEGTPVVRHVPWLPDEERAWIVGRMGDVRLEEVEVNLDEDLRATIRSRSAELIANPSIGLTWDEIKQRVQASRAAGPGRIGRPLRRAHMDTAREFDRFAGRIEVPDDFDAPMSEEELAEWGEGDGTHHD